MNRPSGRQIVFANEGVWVIGTGGDNAIDCFKISRNAMKLSVVMRVGTFKLIG
jgi:hypothetical protein